MNARRSALSARVCGGITRFHMPGRCAELFWLAPAGVMRYSAANPQNGAKPGVELPGERAASGLRVPECVRFRHKANAAHMYLKQLFKRVDIGTDNDNTRQGSNRILHRHRCGGSSHSILWGIRSDNYLSGHTSGAPDGARRRAPGHTRRAFPTGHGRPVC